jgi:hypothetical protein
MYFNIRNTLPKSGTFLLGHPVYRAVILPIVLYEFEIWFLILGEEQRLEVFENTVLSYILGPSGSK